MANYRPTVLTKSGIKVLQSVIQGKSKLEFSKIKIGVGVVKGDISELTDLVNSKIEANITAIKNNDDGSCSVCGSYSNEGMTESYTLNEIGVFVKDSNGTDVLYAYSTADGEGDWFGHGSTILQENIEIVVYVSTAENITANIVRTAKASEIISESEYTGISANNVEDALKEIKKSEKNTTATIDKILDGRLKTGNANKLSNLDSTQFVRSDVATKLNVGRGDVYIENNMHDNIEGVGNGITIRPNINPNNGKEGVVDSIFAVRSSGGIARLWVGQSMTSTGDNELETRKVNITSADSNTKFGFETLEKTTGANNTAIGFRSLQANTTGISNTAVGYGGLWKNTTGNNNTALGHRTLFENTTGNLNTAVGVNALSVNSTGVENTAVGVESMASNTQGYWNTAVGVNSLRKNTVGTDNVAIGNYSMLENTTSTRNVAIGARALQENTTGEGNIAVGYDAGRYITDGVTPNTVSSNCVYIGRELKSKAINTTNEIVIGAYAAGYGSNTAHIGNSSVGSISFGAGTSTSFTNRSDERLKTDIELADLDICYENIIKKLPIKRFKYIDEYAQEKDKHKIGFIAQDFEKVLPKSVYKSKALLNKLDKKGNKIKKVVKNKYIKTIKDDDGLEYNEVFNEELKIDDVYETEEEMLSIDVSQLLPMTIGALQRLATIVEQQQEVIKEMRNEIVELSKVGE